MKAIVVVLAVFFLNACTSLQQVRIVRDNYGVPHIYAENIYGLYYGYGYAIAQDRLFQIEMARRSTQGTVSEVLGPDYLEYDKNARVLFSPDSIRQQLDGLQKLDKDVFEAYASGVNAWLGEIRSSPSELTPKQFNDHGFKPADWTAYDVVMIFIGTMNNRYGDFNTELENLAILNSLVAQHGKSAGGELFNLLNPRFTDDAPTTIPREDWSRPAYNSLANTTTFNRASSDFHIAFEPSVVSGFSNCYVLGEEKVEGASSILVNGPQFGWFNPSYVYSVGMHGAGIDVVGNTPFGYPIIMFGHNQTISWGSTWGASDIVDIYSEQLNPEDNSQYLYKGEFVDLEHRVERIQVLGQPDIDFDVYRSVHGPIIHTDTDAGVVYAKKRAWDGGELATLLAWLQATWVADFNEWKTEAAKSAINVNMYYADVDGNIGYFHGGKFPRRVSGHDNRLPVTGDGSMDWQGRQSVDLANPHVLNPVSGFLANWNNKPAHGVMNPDFFFYSWSSADRVEFLNDALEAKDRFTPDEAWALLDSSSYADMHAPYFLTLINEVAEKSGDPKMREANEILQTWNRQSRDDDADGFYDEPATAIFRAFLVSLIEQTLSDDLGDVYQMFAASGYPSHAQPSDSGTNIPAGVKAIVEAIEGDAAYDLFNGNSAKTVIVTALRIAVRHLVDNEQRLDDLRLPVASRPFGTSNFLGIPQAGKNELMVAPIEQNRGTENNMIVMERDKIIGWEVTPPGQNAFIDAKGKKSKHYDDQFEMYHEFGKKRMWFYADDVEANKNSETFLAY